MGVTEEVSSADFLLLVFQRLTAWPLRGPVWHNSQGHHRQAWDRECPLLPKAQEHGPLSALGGAEEVGLRQLVAPERGRAPRMARGPVEKTLSQTLSPLLCRARPVPQRQSPSLPSHQLPGEGPGPDEKALPQAGRNTGRPIPGSSSQPLAWRASSVKALATC